MGIWTTYSVNIFVFFPLWVFFKILLCVFLRFPYTHEASFNHTHILLVGLCHKGKGTSTETMPSSDWPLGHFLD